MHENSILNPESDLQDVKAAGRAHLDRIGLKNGIHPSRMDKLIRPTYIVPGELIKRGYSYQTDIKEGLRRWLQDDPQGAFV